MIVIQRLVWAMENRVSTCQRNSGFDVDGAGYCCCGMCLRVGLDADAGVHPITSSLHEEIFE